MVKAYLQSTIIPQTSTKQIRQVLLLVHEIAPCATYQREPPEENPTGKLA